MIVVVRLPGNPPASVVVRDVMMTLCFASLLWLCLDIWRAVHGMSGALGDHAIWRKILAEQAKTSNERLDAIEKLVHSLADKMAKPTTTEPTDGR